MPEARRVAAVRRFGEEGVQFLFGPGPRHVEQVEGFAGRIRDGLVVLEAAGRAAFREDGEAVDVRFHGWVVHAGGEVVPRHDDHRELQAL